MTRLLFLVLLVAPPALAQPRLQYGVAAGLTTTPGDDSFVREHTLRSRTLAVFAERITEREDLISGLRGEVGFHRRAWSWESSGPGRSELRSTTRVLYLHAHPAFKLGIPMGGSAPFLTVGPRLDVLLWAGAQSVYTIDRADGPARTETSVSNLRGGYRQLVLGATAGVGVEFRRAQSRPVIVEARLTQDVTSVHEPTGLRGEELRMQTFEIRLGTTF